MRTEVGLLAKDLVTGSWSGLALGVFLTLATASNGQNGLLGEYFDNQNFTSGAGFMVEVQSATESPVLIGDFESALFFRLRRH